MISPPGRTVVIAGKVLLVAVTVMCLLSIGGAMLFAFPILVPLHWLAARSSSGYGVGAWTVLAAASVFQAGWMLAYVATESVGASLVVGAVAGAATAVLFLRRAADRHVERVQPVR